MAYKIVNNRLRVWAKDIGAMVRDKGIRKKQPQASI
jgi:hypothetical protein